MILSFTSQPSLAERTSYSFNLLILQGDILAIYVRPIAQDLVVQGSSPSSNNFTVGWTPSEGRNTLVWMSPASPGIYNLTVSFRTEDPWDYTVGVFTSNKDFYKPASVDVTSGQPGGYFVRLHPLITGSSPGNITLTFILNCYGRTSGFFIFSFPTELNGVVFLAAVICLGYVDAFSILDLYFKNKIEGSSKKRWFLTGLLILASLLGVYFMYSFTTFKPIGGG